MAVTAQVAVSDATMYYDKLYTYLVPPLLEERVFVGSMVLVPFGRGKARPRTGVVLALQNTAEVEARTKPLYDAAPEEARLTEELLSIVKYLKEATFCTWFEAVKAVIPYGAQYKAAKTDEGWRLQSQMVRYTRWMYRLAAPVAEVRAGGRKPGAKQQAVLRFLQAGEKPQEEILEACGVTKAVLDTL
ncbi:MAG: primosomal protein N', partial [Oscillospiraceae bacterium]